MATEPKGFTLLEVLLASIIFSIIGTLTFGSLSATFKTQASIDKRTQLQEIGTAAIYKIRDDLTQAFHVQTSRPLTFFRGEDQDEFDRIDFTSLSRSIISVDGRESDQTEITYKAETDSRTPSLRKLLRRQTRYIDGILEEEGGDFSTLATNVILFNIEYSDGEKYRNEWDIMSRDYQNRLPKLVHVTLGLRDDRGREEFFETITRLPMAEDLSASPATRTRTPGGTTPTPGQPPTPNPRGTPPTNAFGGGNPGG